MVYRFLFFMVPSLDVHVLGRMVATCCERLCSSLGCMCGSLLLFLVLHAFIYLLQLDVQC